MANDIRVQHMLWSFLLTSTALLLGSQEVNAGWFLGCFKEKPEERVFNISAGNYRITDTSAQECTSACDHLNQTYAATEGDLCFCASGSYDKYGQASNESLCNLNCSDGVSCNNISYIRVYDTQGSVGGLNIDAPQIGWLWQELNFSASLEEGDVNVSYSFDFGDETYLLSTCPNVTHTYTRTGYFLVKASARNNVSGPVMTSVWIFIHSSTGLVSLDYPKNIVEAGNETEITVTVSQGTWMKAEVVTFPRSKVRKFNISDAIVQDVGSSATYGNKSVSSDEGAYIIPSAMIRTDGYILAWEYLASKVGPVRIQVYRPSCSSRNDQFCPKNQTCIPKSETCVNTSHFTCPNQSLCVGAEGCLSNCQMDKISFPSGQSPFVNYTIIAESLINISKDGKNILALSAEKAIQVQTGDVIGWVADTSSGALAFESTINDPSFFYPKASFNIVIGETLSASGSVDRRNIKHVLRAHVSQPSQAIVNINFTEAGVHNVTAVVFNKAENVLQTCEISVQERIQNLFILRPFRNQSYATGDKVELQSTQDKGSNINYLWSVNGRTQQENTQSIEVTFNRTGIYPISVRASNNISSAEASSMISVLDPVSMDLLEEPQDEVDVGAQWNVSLTVNGTNVTVSVSFGDQSPLNTTFLESSQVVSFHHKYTERGPKHVNIKAVNNILAKPEEKEIKVKVIGECIQVVVEVSPERTVDGVLKISTGQDFTIHVSTTPEQRVNYTFYFNEDSTPDTRVTNEGDTTVSHNYNSETNYNITLKGSPLLCEDPFVPVIAKKCSPPSFLFPDRYTRSDPKVITKASPVDFLKVKEPARNSDQCPNQEPPQYRWNISLESSAGSYNPEGFSTDDSSLDIPAQRLKIGNYSITLNVSVENNSYFFQTYVRVVSSALIADIKGGSYLEVDSQSLPNHELTLDASGSKDPDSSQSELKFTWECKFKGNLTEETENETCLSTNFVKLNETSSKVTYRLRENVTYTFKVTVRSEGRSTSASASATQAVRMLPDIPSLTISCPNCRDKINPQERVTFLGNCTNCHGLQKQLATQTWKLLYKNHTEVQLSENDTDSNLGLKSINLVLKDRVLNGDSEYIARLEGTRGNGKSATVEYRFRTTSAPRSGTCAVTPKSGLGLETLFEMKCSNWVTSDSSDSPISYKFFYGQKQTDLAKINTLSTDAQANLLWYYGEKSTSSSSFPLGNEDNGFKLALSVLICNKYDCCAECRLTATVKPKTTEDYQKLKENITKELEKTSPDDVPRVVISVASSLNFDNKTDSKSEQERKEIRSKLVDSLATSFDLQDNEQAQVAMSALITVSQKKTELTPQTQIKAADIISRASDVLKKGAHAKNLGPVRVEEDSRSIYTAASNVLEASKETSQSFVIEALNGSFPTDSPPSRDWAQRNRYLESEQDAQESKQVVDTIIFKAIDAVSGAIQKSKVVEQGETTVHTSAFSLRLKTSRKKDVNATVMEGSLVRFELPDPSAVLKDYKDDHTIAIQYTSMNNAFLSDPKWSPYINQKIQGFSLKQGEEDIVVQNLDNKLQMNIPVNITDVSKRYNHNFTAKRINTHRYQVIPDAPYDRFLVRVHPENGEELNVNLSITYETSSSLYKLSFPTPPDETEIAAPFQKADNYSYIAWKLPSRPIILNLNVTIAKPFSAQEGSGNKSRALHVTYSVAIYAVQCMYWDRNKYEWLDTGCEVGHKTTSEYTQCFCNHATFFGSLNVRPNPIDPPTFAALKKGYAMLIFVSVIFLLYFIALIWARRKDRADVIKVGVCPLRDNDPSDPYRYEITLWTGMRRNAGTKSKVSMIVYGDEHDSEPRSLEYPDRSPFQRGSQDTFLLTTPFSMGTIQYIRIWHDNGGGSWFLSRIMVIDLQTDERYYFICNRWLAVDEEDGQVERLVPLASKEELTEFGHLFVARTRRNLSDSHLWFSVLARPANSRFTRVQRLSCCLCLLLMSMMASGMYYERENDSANVQHVGQFVFTWEQVLIGIISSLIVFPINLIVVQIFRNVRPKPKVKPKKPPPQLPSLSFTKDNIENYNHLKESSDESAKGSNNSLDSSRERNNRTRLSINDVHTDIDRASFTDSPLLIDRRLSTVYEIAPTSRWRRAVLFFKKRNSLPYQAVYLAWFLVFAFSTGSAVVVVLYGMQFKNVKSLQWLFSSVVSFVQDILITQPLKVLGLAVFFALVVKKPDQGEFEITEEALKLAEDEEFLQQSNQTGEKTNKAKLLPPDQAKLIAMRTARLKERKMYSVIREVVTYYFFVALLLTIAYTHRSPTAFYQTTNMVNMIGASFSNITNQREFWNWAQNDLLNNLFPGTWYNGAKRQPDGYMADGYSQMVGGARMRLLRIKQESCQVPSEIYGITNECYGEYYITGDDKNDYTPGWNITTYATKISWDDMPWRYQNSTQLDGYPFWAKLTTYGGAGYVIVLEPAFDNHARIKKLENNLWIERHTRAILTEFTIYNAQSNLFCIVTLVAEFSAIGAVLPYISVQTARLYDFTDSYMFFVLAIDVLFVLFILFFTYREVKSIYKSGIQAYVKEFWNCVEFGIIAFTFAAIALYVYRALTIRNVLDLVRYDPFNFKSFQFAAYWDESYTFILAIIVLLANIKLNKLLRFNKRFSLLSSTLKYAYYPLVMFSIVWGIVFMAFTLFASLVFGPIMYNYRNVLASLTSLLSLMLGRTAYFEMRDTNRIIGPLFFFGFMFMMSFVLINMFLSIVVDSFLVVKHDNDKQSNEYEIVDFIIERFKLWSGIGKTRRPHSRRRVLWDTAACRVKAINAFRDRGHSVTIAGLHKDMVSELENRLEKLVVRTDVLYDELFPEKRRSKITGKQGAVKVKLPLSKADLLEGRTG